MIELCFYKLKRINLKTQDGKSTKDISIIEESIANANENDTLNRASSLERDQIDELPYEQESFENEDIKSEVKKESPQKSSKLAQNSTFVSHNRVKK